LSLAETSGPNRVPAKVKRVTRLGSSLEIEITVAGQPLLVAQSTEVAPAPDTGADAFLQLPHTAPLLH